MWGVSSPVVVNRRFVAKVGVKCSAGCPLAGQPIVVRNESSADVGHGRLDEKPEPGTTALYAAELTLTAPAEEAVHNWTATFAGAAPDSTQADEALLEPESAPGHEVSAVRETVAVRGASPASRRARTRKPAPTHADAAATFGFRTVSPPEHRVAVTVCDRETEAPLAGAEVRVGVYRGTTDANGHAGVEVQAGAYELYVRKPGYAPHTDSVEVSGDVILQVAAARVSDADMDDDQVWM